MFGYGSAIVSLAVGALVVVAGCATSSETASRDTLTTHVGVYDYPPSALKMVRVGVPPFLDASAKEKAQASTNNLGALAADQLTTLAVNSMRFDVIERAQLEQLLREQELEGIVDPNELAQPGKVRGVEYMLIGKITNFRVKTEKSTTGFGLATIGDVVGAVDIKNDKTQISVDCGVDLRLVSPTTGSTLAAQFGEYKRTDTLSALGVDVLGANATAEGELELDEDNQGKILRLAIDDAMRKMLPLVDRKLLQLQREQATESGG